VPDIDGLDAIYGRSAHQCPFCDGWEERDGAFGLYGEGDEGAVAALGLVTWSADILFFNAGDAPSPPKQAALDKKNIRVVQERIARLDSKDQRLTHVVLENGERIARSALFLHCGQTAASTFATDLGCASGEKAGCVQGDAHGRTNVPGVYVAGDLHPPVQLAIVAAGEGARAAHAMVCDLREAET
jgi:thioredoxin reductase